jgi:ribosomal protein S27AE
MDNRDSLLTFGMFVHRSTVHATGPLCRCGSQTVAQDVRYRWRCGRGHFSRYPFVVRRRRI